MIAVVGYTNAGKSALVNRLAKTDLLSQDQVFASLDATLRQVYLPSKRQGILIDTVGFISDLPGLLHTAFRSTLEEVERASLCLHVRDISHPESEYQKANVLEILKSLRGGSRLIQNHIEVWNKIDLLSEEELEKKLKEQTSSATVVPVSALTGVGCSQLLQTIDNALLRQEAKKERTPER